MRYAVIMAGGSGTRLWPLSRKGEPKQLLDLINGKSLLRLAFERVNASLPADHILVCTGAAYADKVRQILPEMPPENLLGEPVGRDSLNAVAWPAAVLAERDSDAVIAMVTADQIIEPAEVFADRLETAFQVAEHDPSALVTFGIVPTSAHTGYGYLHQGAQLPGFSEVAEVAEFAEKPNAEVAHAYLTSGEYWWNSGMFVWQARTLLEQLEILQPQTYASVVELARHPDKLNEIYPQLMKISVDYAIMEPVSRGEAKAHVVAVALHARWADVGSFASLYAELPHDDHGNACQGAVVAEDTRDCLLINAAPGNTVLAVTGLHSMAVVRTESADLVCPLGASQQVKSVVAAVSEEIDPELA